MLCVKQVVAIIALLMVHSSLVSAQSQVIAPSHYDALYVMEMQQETQRTLRSLERFYDARVTMSASEANEIAERCARLETGTDSGHEFEVRQRAREIIADREAILKEGGTLGTNGKANARFRQYRSLARIRYMDFSLNVKLQRHAVIQDNISRGVHMDISDVSLRGFIERGRAELTNEIQEFSARNSTVGGRGGNRVPFNSSTLLTGEFLTGRPRLRGGPSSGGMVNGVSAESPVPDIHQFMPGQGAIR